MNIIDPKLFKKLKRIKGVRIYDEVEEGNIFTYVLYNHDVAVKIGEPAIFLSFPTNPTIQVVNLAAKVFGLGFEIKETLINGLVERTITFEGVTRPLNKRTHITLKKTTQFLLDGKPEFIGPLKPKPTSHNKVKESEPYNPDDEPDEEDDSIPDPCETCKSTSCPSSKYYKGNKPKEVSKSLDPYDGQQTDLSPSKKSAIDQTALEDYYRAKMPNDIAESKKAYVKQLLDALMKGYINGPANFDFPKS